MTLSAPLVTDGGVIASRAEYDRVLECLENPPPPTPAILEAADRLRKRPVPNQNLKQNIVPALEGLTELGEKIMALGDQITAALANLHFAADLTAALANNNTAAAQAALDSINQAAAVLQAAVAANQAPMPAGGTGPTGAAL